MITSKNILLISSAAALSITAFVMSTPPNADTGSPASASVQASNTVGREARPQALLCFSMAKVVSVNSFNQVNGSVDIEQVVIRDFLTVYLVEHSIQIAIEITFLMRILTIA